ncbi:phosphatidate cytidylyltransferase [Mycoplasmatota bacterium WC44]
MKTRVISAILMLCVLIPVLFVNSTIPIIIVGLIASAIAGFEYARMAKVNKCTTILFSIVGYYSLVANVHTPKVAEILAPSYLILVSFLSTVIYLILRDRDLKELYGNLVSLIYIGFGVGSIVVLKTIDTRVLVYLAIVIATTDTFAYIFGVNFGKHKLAPTISPKKSIEGSVAGVIFATVFGALYIYFSGMLTEFPNILVNIYIAVILTIIVSIVGQIGDLFASKVKRTYNVKDFGTIFPGHGGVLDRFDSLILGAMVLFILFL